VFSVISVAIKGKIFATESSEATEDVEKPKLKILKFGVLNLSLALRSLCPLWLKIKR